MLYRVFMSDPLIAGVSVRGTDNSTQRAAK
jgi:hypothetical protein